MILVPLVIVAAILTLALSFKVQAAVIMDRPNLRRTANLAGGFCLGFGFVFIVIGALIQLGLLPWTAWADWTVWESAGIILFFSAGAPLLVQGYGLGKARSDLTGFARYLYTFGRVLTIIAAVFLVIIIIIPFAIPWLLNIFK